LPPLRERVDDILMLAEHFAINMARELEFELFSGFSEKAKRTLLDYHWPGNIRELKNVVERSVYRNNNPHIPVHELVIDPFESPYRPQVSIRHPTSVNDNTTTDNENNTMVVDNSDTLTSNNLTEINQQSNSVINRKTTIESEQFPVSLKQLSQDYEIELISHALSAHQFNQKKTAQALKLTYHQLRGYLKKYNLLDGANDD
jgi:psp operon transcriptional activator